tara:strand:+ start:7831 stop:8352 length:522 start_codon:yes stop_codon:yes gene_type:complete
MDNKKENQEVLNDLKNFVDESNGDNSMFGQQYNLPEDITEFVDVGTGEVVEQEQVDPMDVIRKIAEKTGNKIQDPNPKCRKCYGRGYTARDAKTKAPIPCKCIHPKLEGDEALEQQYLESQMRQPSRGDKRAMKRQMEKILKKEKKNKAKKKKREFQKQRQEEISKLKKNEGK